MTDYDSRKKLERLKQIKMIKNRLEHSEAKQPKVGLIRLILINALVFLSLFETQVSANSDTAISKVNNSEALNLFSEGKATWLWIEVYKAKLFTSDQVINTYDSGEFKNTKALQSLLLADKQPIKLQLCYKQSISAEQIIEAAFEGLPENISTEAQQAVYELHDSYQSVEPGDCYALQHNAEGTTELKFNDNEVFTTNLSGFKALYFGIWLGDLALSDSLKASLLKEGEE